MLAAGLLEIVLRKPKNIMQRQLFGGLSVVH